MHSIQPHGIDPIIPFYCVASPSGLVPADKSKVDCEMYMYVPAGVLILGGLDEQGVTVTQGGVFALDQRLQ